MKIEVALKYNKLERESCWRLSLFHLVGFFHRRLVNASSDRSDLGFAHKKTWQILVVNLLVNLINR